MTEAEKTGRAADSSLPAELPRTAKQEADLEKRVADLESSLAKVVAFCAKANERVLKLEKLADDVRTVGEQVKKSPMGGLLGGLFPKG